MDPVWRHKIIGPLVTLVTGAAIFLVDRYLVQVPTPGALTFLAALYAAFRGGIVPVLLSTVIALGWGFLFLVEPGPGLSLHAERLARFPTLVVVTLICPFVVAALGRRASRALLQERRALEQERASGDRLQEAIDELLGLRVALDQVEYGVVLLDRQLRAQYINRAYRRIWRLSDEKADSRPTFAELMRHGCDTEGHNVPADKLEDYVAQRVALVWMGDPRPRDLRLGSGEVIRFQCSALPEGGRLLSYTNVTDLVQHADQLESLVTIDRMTGINNRAHFLTRALDEWGRFIRYGGPLSLIMVDIDHFKSINDNLGHDAGDQVIIQVATMCDELRRAVDIVARVGGEEFAILLPETDLDGARVLAERLRERVAERRYSAARTSIGATVSLGVAQADVEMSDFSALMKRTDEALYRAKRNGRNRVEVASIGSLAVSDSGIEELARTG